MPLTATTEMSKFAETVYKSKYAWKNERGEPVETWPDTARRVVSNVLGVLNYQPGDREFDRLQRLITERKFMPGGRYLYAAGRGLHMVNNCLMCRAEDSREGWADLMQKTAMTLMTGAGLGVDYSDIRGSGEPISRTGGEASGPLSLMAIINEIGRNVMMGGGRRSALWAGLNYKHKDIFRFIDMKNWSPEVRALKEKDFNFPATMDMTNISVLLDDEFFVAFEDWTHPQHPWAKEVYWRTVRRMLKTAEPGFAVDIGENAGETLANAPVAGETMVLTPEGYRKASQLVGSPSAVWTGKQWAYGVLFTKTGENKPIVKVEMTGGRFIRCEPWHEFVVEDWKGAGKGRHLAQTRKVAAIDLRPGDQLHVSMPESPPFGAIDKEAYTLGFVYADDQKWQSRIKDEFPEEVYSYAPDPLRSFIAGLFDGDGNWEPTQKRIRLSSNHRSFLRGVGRALEQLGIVSHVSANGHSSYGRKQTYQLVVSSEYMEAFASQIPTCRLRPGLDGYHAYRHASIKVLSISEDGHDDVYCADVGVPEHSFMAEGVIISNCTELRSRDDSDVCCLGSINLARIRTLDEFKEVVDLAILFLIAGTVYSDVPYPQVAEIRDKNRRLGLGLMGIHEWLLMRGKRYEPDEELGRWLEEYAKSGTYAEKWAYRNNLSVPVKTRAIAPTGTISIVAEATSGIEPIFCVSYKRRYKTANPSGPDKIEYQYVVDPTARRLIDNGVDPDSIEDAYVIEVERRIAFQAWVQQWVDHAISSTTNVPAPITDDNEVKEFGEMLLKYLPELRGITVYPDGARGGQPLTAVPLSEALGKEGVVFEEDDDRCVGGICGL